MRFDLLSLKLFVTVCELQSISRAAEMERIAASAVSKRISDLEAIVKTPLFLRNQKGLDLTPAAHDLLKHARIVLLDLGQLESEMLDHSKGRRGEVRLHACHAAISQHLPDDLADFLALNPAIRVSIDEGPSRSVVLAVSENAADVGIFSGEATPASMRVAPYRADRLVVMMPTGHPLAGTRSVRFADIAPYDIIGPRQGSCLDQLMNRAAAALDRPLQLRVRLDGFDPTSRMVEAGLGVALASEHYALRRAATGGVVLATLDEAWAVRQWSICSRDPRALPAATRSLLDHLRAQTRPREPVTLPAMASLVGRAALRNPVRDRLVSAG